MQCVILAAGEGKRMRPLTASRPKVMLPVANRPMIEHLIIAARECGIEDFILVVGYGEQEIRTYFGDGSSRDVSIHYVTQRQQLGTADALRAAEPLIRGRFLLMNGDMILKAGDIKAICDRNAPSVGIFPGTQPERFGVITVDGDRVTGLVEKSSKPPSNLINAGVYLFEKGVFDLLSELNLSERGEYELTDALFRYIEDGRLAAHRLSFWLDIGAPWNLIDANEVMMKDLQTDILGEIEEGVFISGPVSLGKGSVIKSGTCIEGPCTIGENCRIGPHAYLRGSTAIGSGCHIGHSTEIKNSVILTGTKIPHFNYIGDSVIGSGCNFGAGTKIANLRHDHTIIKSGGYITGRKKFGAVIGDNVQFGINCSINVGCVVGSGVKVAPHQHVHGTIADNTTIR
ncbi:MAG: sugar phosphate nucleotidyltransferase [Methanomicrobiaceae archaeon]|nr:sugar phosphate nucleotidyltransferase [Methanomicrobiaceae archaeon]